MSKDKQTEVVEQVAEVESIVETTEVEAPAEPVELTQEEQLAAYEATLLNEHGYDVTQKDLEAALSNHLQLSTKLSSAWTLQEVKDFLESGVVPAKTSNGVWVNDVTRANRKAGGWSTEEIEAWALGEVKAEGRATDGALAQALISRLALKVNATTPEAVIEAYMYQVHQVKATAAKEEVKVEEVKPAVIEQEAPAVKNVAIILNTTGLSEMNVKYIENVLEQYLTELKPGKAVTTEKGLVLQKGLDTVIRYIINLPDPAGFKSGMDFLMSVIAKNRDGGVFDDTYAMRFTDGLAVGGKVQENHLRLLTLFFVYADADKSFRKQADVAYLLEHVAPDKQPLLMQYFEQYK